MLNTRNHEEAGFGSSQELVVKSFAPCSAATGACATLRFSYYREHPAQGLAQLPQRLQRALEVRARRRCRHHLQIGFASVPEIWAMCAYVAVARARLTRCDDAGVDGRRSPPSCGAAPRRGGSSSSAPTASTSSFVARDKDRSAHPSPAPGRATGGATMRRSTTCEFTPPAAPRRAAEVLRAPRRRLRRVRRARQRGVDRPDAAARARLARRDAATVDDVHVRPPRSHVASSRFRRARRPRTSSSRATARPRPAGRGSPDAPDAVRRRGRRRRSPSAPPRRRAASSRFRRGAPPTTCSSRARSRATRSPPRPSPARSRGCVSTSSTSTRSAPRPRTARASARSWPTANPPGGSSRARQPPRRRPRPSLPRARPGPRAGPSGRRAPPPRRGPSTRFARSRSGAGARSFRGCCFHNRTSPSLSRRGYGLRGRRCGFYERPSSREGCASSLRLWPSAPRRVALVKS